MKVKSSINHCFLHIILLSITIVEPIQLLDGVPVVFKIDGNVTYVPTSGVTQIPGYKVLIGYDKNSWLGIKFMDVTSNSNYDILVVQRQNKPVGGVYQTTVSDYFVSSGRQDKLISDSVNNMDKHVTTYEESNYFFVEIYRTKGNTKGQDWEKDQFVQICFLTSSKQFDINEWSNLIESCYGYSVSQDYISTYRGKKINQMQIDGKNSFTYGGIEGPPLAMHIFWYCPKPTLSSQEVILRIGDQIDPQVVGYDFFKCGSGDYFGKKSSSMTSDVTWSGFNDGYCNIESSTVSTQIFYSRNVYTYDDFDGTIYNETNICVYIGSTESCSLLAFENLYPIINVSSSFVIFERCYSIPFYFLLAIICAFNY